jgi:hypothetical protein
MEHCIVFRENQSILKKQNWNSTFTFYITKIFTRTLPELTVVTIFADTSKVSLWDQDLFTPQLKKKTNSIKSVCRNNMIGIMNTVT